MNANKSLKDKYTKDKYTEAGDLLRHYSAMRGVVLSLLIPMCFGMVGIVLTNMSNKTLVAYLVISELLLFSGATYASIYLSKHVTVLRKCLIALEAGKDTNPYNVLDKIRLFHGLEMDIFDKLLLGVGILFHIGFYIYIASKI
jgi:hypothetical protein